MLAGFRVLGAEGIVMTRQEIMDTIDEATGPEAMTKAEALEFLEELATDIEGRIEALKEELRENGNADK